VDVKSRLTSRTRLAVGQLRRGFRADAPQAGEVVAPSGRMARAGRLAEGHQRIEGAPRGASPWSETVGSASVCSRGSHGSRTSRARRQFNTGLTKPKSRGPTAP